MSNNAVNIEKYKGKDLCLDILSGYIAFTIVMCFVFVHPPKISTEKIVMQIALFYAAYSIYPAIKILFFYLYRIGEEFKFIGDCISAFFYAYKLGLLIVFVPVGTYTAHNELLESIGYPKHFNFLSFLSELFMTMIPVSAGLILFLLFFLPILYYLKDSNKDKNITRQYCPNIFVLWILGTICSFYHTVSACLFFVSIYAIPVLLYQ
jgi:hypothetical protein